MWLRRIVNGCIVCEGYARLVQLQRSVKHRKDFTVILASYQSSMLQVSGPRACDQGLRDLDRILVQNQSPNNTNPFFTQDDSDANLIENQQSRGRDDVRFINPIRFDLTDFPTSDPLQPLVHFNL